MKWFACLITGLTLAPGLASAQADRGVAIDSHLIEQLQQSNRTLAKSNERLAETLQHYRTELGRLRRDRDGFREELKTAAKYVDQLKAQMAGLQQQIAALYKQNIEYAQETAKLRLEQAKRISLPGKTNNPVP